jgi:hypothetical protein
MADFTLSRGVDENPLVLAASAAAGEVWQLADGRAAYMAGLTAGVAGDTRTFTTTGTGVLTKTAGFVAIKGRRAYWDYSANAVYYKKVNDRDFYIGRFAADAASADTTCAVILNINPPADIDLLRDGVISVPTGTKAAGAFGYPKTIGGAATLELTATNEAQCIDMLSRDRFAVGANFTADFVIVPEANGSDNTVDFNIGVANGTSTTDADAVTEHVFAHIDGGSTNINAQSKDGTTTVTSTDTTADISAGTAVANRTEIWIDGRDPSSVKIYVDGSRVLSGTTFVLTAATGPLGILAHLEKVSGTATGKFTIERAEVQLREQD